MSFSKCLLTPVTRVGVTVQAPLGHFGRLPSRLCPLSVTNNCLVCTNLTPTSAVGGPFLKVYILSIFFLLFKKKKTGHAYIFIFLQVNGCIINS